MKMSLDFEEELRKTADELNKARQNAGMSNGELNSRTNEVMREYHQNRRNNQGGNTPRPPSP
jgi:hypothetical protein